MAIDPDTLSKGDMLLSPDGELYNVTEAIKIVLNFAFIDEATKAAAAAEGWKPLDESERGSYIFTLTSLDGQEKTSLTAFKGEPIVDGWQIIAQAPEQPSGEPGP